MSAERSVAIDPKYVPLGAPLFLSTTQPNSQNALKRLMIAQDTGGAIKGGVRADYFWGAGDAAGKQAGSMKQICIFLQVVCTTVAAINACLIFRHLLREIIIPQMDI